MHESGYVDGEGFADDDSELAVTTRARSDAEGEESPLDRLEARVKLAVERLQELREERETLRGDLAERDLRIAELEKMADGAAATRDEVTALVQERDRLLQDRAAMVRRVETVLERLDAMGLE